MRKSERGSDYFVRIFDEYRANRLSQGYSFLNYSFVPLLPTSFLFSGISFRPDLSGSQCDAPSDKSYSSWKSTISSTCFSRSTSFFFFRWELIETSQSNWYLRNPLKMSISKNTRSHKLMTKKRFTEMLIRKVEGWRGRGELMVLNDYLC